MTSEPARLPILTEFLFRIAIMTDGGRVNFMPDSPWGSHADVAVVGGTVTGPKVNGVVLDMGGDWGLTTIQDAAGGALKVTDLDCKLLIRTDEELNNPDEDWKRIIQMSYVGVSYHHGGTSHHYEPGDVKDPSEYYFRTTPRFRTSAPKYEWLNRVVAVASGYHREKEGPIYDVYAVL
jgi:hypothetical protein